MRRESMEQEMNRPGLVTRRSDPTSLSSRRRRATLRAILLPLDVVESDDPVPVPRSTMSSRSYLPVSAPPAPPETMDCTHGCWRQSLGAQHTFVGRPPAGPP
jgi:hypothetical protein